VCVCVCVCARARERERERERERGREYLSELERGCSFIREREIERCNKSMRVRVRDGEGKGERGRGSRGGNARESARDEKTSKKER